MRPCPRDSRIPATDRTSFRARPKLVVQLDAISLPDPPNVRGEEMLKIGKRITLLNPAEVL